MLVSRIIRASWSSGRLFTGISPVFAARGNLGVDFPLAEFIQTRAASLFLYRLEGGDEVMIHGGFLLLRILPEGLPEQFTHGPIFLPGEFFRLFELQGREGH
jgi:hypothetical protein